MHQVGSHGEFTQYQIGYISFNISFNIHVKWGGFQDNAHYAFRAQCLGKILKSRYFFYEFHILFGSGRAKHSRDQTAHVRMHCLHYCLKRERICFGVLDRFLNQTIMKGINFRGPATLTGA